MEVPDKIWINTDTLDGYHMSNHPLYGEVYIRKNALLEWAKGEIMPGNSAEGKGWNCALQVLIDKIKSL